MKGQHIFIPTGGLNSDDSIELIPKEDYIYAENVEIGFNNKGAKGSVRTIAGDKAMTQDLGPGEYETIGKTQDNESNKLIEFIREANGGHVIQQVDRNDVAEVIARGSYLGFNTNRINCANVIDGILTWSQEGQPPKSFNLEKMRLFTVSDGGSINGYQTIDSDTILAGALPPNFRPQSRYITLPEIKTNHIVNQTYQFSYFYVYDDNGRSTPSPISNLVIPQSQWGPTGKLFGTDNIRNGIEVNFNTGMHTVESIVLMFREGNIGAWKIFRTIRKSDENMSDNTIGVANFTGQEAGELYSSTFRNFNYIPITADYQEYLNTNKIVYGNFEAGNDKPSPNIELTHERINPTVTSVPVNFYNAVSSEFASNSYLYFDTVPLPGEIVAVTLKPDLFFLNTQQPAVQFDDPTYSLSWTPEVTAFETFYEVTEQDYVNGLEFFMDQLFAVLQAKLLVYNETYLIEFAVIPATIELNPALDEFEGTTHFPLLFLGTAIGIKFTGLMVEFTASTRESGDSRFIYNQEDIINSTTPDTIKSFKSGSYAYLCLNYYDNFNRDNAGVTNRIEGAKGFKIYIPSATEQPAADATEIYANIIKSKIFHRPPAFATHYQWALAPSVNVQSFGYFMVEETDYTYDTLNSLVKLKLNPYGLDSSDVTSGNSINHAITEGDVMRLYSDATTDDYPFETFYEEIEIVSVDGYDVVIKTNIAASITPESIVEIYTPKLINDQNEFYHEFGQEFKIIDPGTLQRRHSGARVDQSADLSIPAETTFNNGDVYIRQRVYPLSPPGVLPYIEDSRFSDWFLFSEYDKGRVVIYDAQSERKKFTSSILHGGSYFEESIINDLWAISPFNVANVGIDFGAITGLIMKGYTLEVYQQHKVNSVYIGRTMATNQDGTTNQIGLSEQTFGSIVPSKDKWGCQDPSSISKSKTHTYFFDKSMGTWCRNASNGIFPISDYKYQTFWANKANDLLKLKEASYSVQSVFDDRHNILITSVYPRTIEASIEGEMVIFSEDDKRWKVHMDASYEHIGFIGSAVYGSVEGQTFRFWMGKDGIFDRTRKFPRIDFAANDQFNVDKVFDQLTETSNGKWQAFELSIPAEYSGTQKDMLSRIFEDNIERSESKYNGEIKGNLLSPGFSKPTLALVNGESMRGRVMIVRLSCFEESTISLSSASVKYTVSMQTP